MRKKSSHLCFKGLREDVKDLRLFLSCIWECVSPDSGNGPALQMTLVWAEGQSSVESAFLHTKDMRLT